jgi:magnesium transporter
MEEAQIDKTLEVIRRALESGRVNDAMLALVLLHPADRADAFSDLDDRQQAQLLPGLDVSTTADLLEELEDDDAADVAGTLSAGFLADVLDEMEPDQAADVLGDLDPAYAAELLADMQDADEVIPLLKHPDESAGGLMTTDFITLRRRTTAAQAIEFLRQFHPDMDLPYYLYVADREGRLVGVAGLRQLIQANSDATIESLMDPNVRFVTAHMDQEDVARTMARYNLLALPVVDDAGVLLGVITHDDVLDVLEEETTEDVLKLAGVEPGPIIDKPYWSRGIFDVARSRFVWLLILFAASTLTGTVLRYFEAELQAVVALTFFIPLIIGTGGNAGSQTVAGVIRALALEEISRRDALRVTWREGQTSLILGSLLALAGFVIVLLWGLGTTLAIVVGLTLLLVCIWANLVGALVPIAADAIGVDPTVMSAPVISTLVDATGLLIYLSVAGLVLTKL